MQLLHSRAVPGAEFASLSVLMKGDVSGDQVTCRMGDPLLFPSALSTFSRDTCTESVKELHQYINSVFKATKSTSSSNKVASLLLQEDEKYVMDVQVFRPSKGRGVGLHYMVIRDRPLITSILPLVFNSSKATANASKAIESDTTGIVLSVGVAGLPSTFGMSSLQYSLSQRMRDCVEILGKSGARDYAASKALLTTVLLTEDEDRLTNSMADAWDRTLIAESEDVAGAQKGLLKKKKSRDADGGVNEAENPLTINSADQARITVERLAVLSVAETDTIFRKFEARANAGEKSTKTRRRKVNKDADLDGFDFRGEKRSEQRDTVGGASVAPSDASSVKSGGSKFGLKQSKNDTRSSMGLNRSRQQSVPALLAPQKDKGRNRRASMEQGIVSSRNLTNSRRQSTDSMGSNWTFESNGVGFGDSAASKQQSVRSFQNDNQSISSSQTPPGNRGGRSRQNFDPFANQTGSIGEATASTESETTSSSMPLDAHFGGAFGDQDVMHVGRSSRSFQSESVGSQGPPRVQVNVALNEDLTCFYKLSKMSSCSVEGVLQVQVKSNAPQGAPFYLLIRDPSNHILSIQENKKFADNMADSLAQEPPSRRPDYKFTVSVPKADNYFPVMRYKCGPELRPVPIRVQTRVRQENQHWRVALQISSNPHNEDNLTDLTIIMGVPPVVRGESLTTSPPGGVWNASKRSVIWCVSELGGGEKFQLQARFESDPDANNDDEEKPKFPVLVRCQCKFAQLSDVEVDVKDIPEVFPAEARMKLNRRFRLSHRERP